MTSRAGYLLQRGSALLMAPLVFIHLAVIVYAVRGGLSAAEILARTSGSAGWALFYGVFVVAASVHATVGLSVVLAEWTPLQRRASASVAGLAGLTLLVLGLRAVQAVIAA